MDASKDQRIPILANRIQQKFVKIAKVARQKDEDGKDNRDEFCCLRKLHALLVFLDNTPSPTVDELRKVELLANSICGRDSFPYRPIDWCFMNFEPVKPGTTVELPIACKDIYYRYPAVNPGNETLCSYLDYIMDDITYEHPWLKFETLTGRQPGKYEVGSPNLLTVVSVEANKKALNYYTVLFGPNSDQYGREMQENLPNQYLQIDFQAAQQRTFELKGHYNDLMRYKGEHVLAEASLKWESVWPCYWGTAPKDAMDSAPTIGDFVRTLTRSLECPKCFEVDIPEGEVLWYVYPYRGVGKRFRTANAVIAGSFKGFFEGMRTKSMVDYNVAGGMDYGVVRTDNEGIGCLSVCIVDICGEVETIDPEPPYEPAPDELTYDVGWISPRCVKAETGISYAPAWSNSLCVKIIR